MSSELSSQYQMKTDKQHILDNPDTYIGSIEQVESSEFIFQDDKLIQKNIINIPGLYKLFDEGIVNCRDHVIRMKKKSDKTNILQVTYINITIDNGTITMVNDGNGIDIAEHPEYKIWIPELIFGHLRTSTNYDKSEKKIVGGKNGFGFKLVLIWSTYGEVETIDHIRKLKYVQKFENNLDVIHKAKITKCTTKKPYTKITFTPDYKRLGISNLSEDMVRLFQKRTYDIAGITDKSIKVKYNGQALPVKGFEQYINMYIGGKDQTPRVFEECGERWTIGACLSPNHEFMQVSFVNGIYTSKGGKHVDYITQQIVKKMCALILKKKKVEVKPSAIKEQIMIFVNSTIENPAFDSQTKDYLNTPVSKFGSSCTISDKFIDKLAKMGILETACALTAVKNNKDAKKTDGSKTKTIRGIHKLVDANYAGTPKSMQCTLLLCEGDSAKAGVISGLSTSDRNIFGVYPLKGKLFNVRGETSKKISENKEIAELKKILGLETGKKYTKDNINTLRYGQVLFLTDQDLDGTHIKGLGLNLFQHEWLSLLQIPNFIGFMNTPILKATKGKKEIQFYNEGEYEAWKSQNGGDLKSWKIKYYKGLGTSTGKEFKEYFANQKIVTFSFDEEQQMLIDMVFNKKRANDRKEWLGKYDREGFVNTNQSSISYEEFINKEMIHFSKYDCDRSIPNLMDGLKISQRKILYSAFKKGLNQEIKVAQFSGYVSEHSGYHHGEASLNGAIINLAQDYVGSNNVNLFCPNGQFGTRLQGGKDSASERYIFTKLHSITRHLFSKNDDAILKYLDDDGQQVEPIYYAPIIPMILVNGAKGIGTGFSTDIMCYNPRDIANYLVLKLNGESNIQSKINPYYKGFKGEIINLSENKYLIKGKYTLTSDTKILITELPIGSWTDDYKQFLENLLDKKNTVIKDYNDNSTDTEISIEIIFTKGVLSQLHFKKIDEHINELEKLLKLYTTQTTNNMHLFNHEEKLIKYNSIYEIIDDFFEHRLSIYDIRKQHQLKVLENLLSVLENKYKYILEVLEGSIDLRKKTSTQIDELLYKKQYIKQNDTYHYLIRLPMDSVNIENVEKLKKERDEIFKELETLKATTIQELWCNEIKGFLIELEKWFKL